MSGRAKEEVQDVEVAAFLAYLQAEAGASPYTQRNYRQALLEFSQWNVGERKHVPNWLKLKRMDFRAFLRFLGRVLA